MDARGHSHGLALLLDVGGTVSRSGLERMAELAEAFPAAADVLARRGPLGPEPDLLWDAMMAGKITEREYWRRRAAEVGAALGATWEVGDLMDALYGLPSPSLRPAALALIADARAAGVTVGVLSNDLAAFHGERVATRYPFLAEVDVVVDGSVTGVLKPDPRAFALAADALDRPPAAIVFVDDMPWNVAAARAAGMRAVAVELDRPDEAFAVARAELGLDRRAA